MSWRITWCIFFFFNLWVPFWIITFFEGGGGLHKNSLARNFDLWPIYYVCITKDGNWKHIKSYKTRVFVDVSTVKGDCVLVWERAREMLGGVTKDLERPTHALVKTFPQTVTQPLTSQNLHCLYIHWKYRFDKNFLSSVTLKSLRFAFDWGW